MEGASRRQRAQIGRRSPNARKRDPRTMYLREGAQQSIGVGVPGLRAQLVAGRRFDDATGVHNGHVVGDLQQERQVVRDEDHGEAEAIAEVGDLSENLALDHHIEGRRRLIHDDELWIESQRDGNDGTLPHAATQLVRKAMQTIGRDAHQTEQLRRALLPALAAHCGIMGAQDVGNLCADVEHRIERVHGALKHDRELAPAEVAQRIGGQLQHIHSVCARRLCACIAVGSRVEEHLALGHPRGRTWTCRCRSRRRDRGSAHGQA